MIISLNYYLKLGLQLGDLFYLKPSVLRAGSSVDVRRCASAGKHKKRCDINITGMY